jgi:hypothetical protein
MWERDSNLDTDSNGNSNSYAHKYTMKLIGWVVVGWFWLLGPGQLLAQVNQPSNPGCCCRKAANGKKICVTATPSVTPTPSATRTVTATYTNTPLLTSTPISTPTTTATATGTVTATPANTATNTPTPTGPIEQAQIFLAGQSRTDTTLKNGSLSFDTSTTAGAFSFPVSHPFRVNKLYTHCETAPGSGKTLDITVLKNGSALTGTCSMANVTTCNVTFTNDSTSDFAVGDQLVLGLTQEVTSATASACHVTIYVRESGDTGENNSIQGNGGGSINLASSTTNFCGPWTGTGGAGVDAHAQCNNTTGSQSNWIATGGTLADFAGRADTWSATSGTFTLLENLGANTVDLSGALVSGTLHFEDTTCTTHCALSAGDTIRIQDVQGGGGQSNQAFRREAWSIDGVGQQFEGTADTVTSGAISTWSGPMRNGSSTFTGNAWPMAKDSTAVNLQVFVLSTTAAITAQLWCGQPEATPTATTLTCTTSTGSNVTCSDTTHNVVITAGSLCAIGWTTGTTQTTNYNNAVVELRPLAAGFTATPTPTITSTPTATPTSTATPTVTPTATLEVCGTSTTPTTNDIGLNAGLIGGSPACTASKNVTVNTLHRYVTTAAGNIICSAYTVSGTTATSPSSNCKSAGTAAVTGWNDLPVTSEAGCQFNNGDVIYVLCNVDDNSLIYGMTTNSGSNSVLDVVDYPLAYPGLPSPITVGTGEGTFASYLTVRAR